MSKLNIYHHELRPNEYAEFYLKYEADNVIADKDAKIAELKDKSLMHDFFWEGCGFKRRGFKNSIAVSEAYDFLEEENAQLKESIAVYQRNEKIDIREIRHHKYKRCLAMARWCESEAYIHEHGSDYDEDLVAWFGKWYKRWLELAEKFKEEK